MASSPGQSQGLGLARGLGWFSIALGLLELAAPRAVTRPLGLRGRERLVRAYGLREIGTGIGILTASDPAPWVWGRVAGDVLDVGTAAAGIGRKPGNTLLALSLLAGVGALDILCAKQLGGTKRPGAAPGNPETGRSITAGATAE